MSATTARESGPGLRPVFAGFPSGAASRGNCPPCVDPGAGVAGSRETTKRLDAKCTRFCGDIIPTTEEVRR